MSDLEKKPMELLFSILSFNLFPVAAECIVATGKKHYKSIIITFYKDSYYR